MPESAYRANDYTVFLALISVFSYCVKTILKEGACILDVSRHDDSLFSVSHPCLSAISASLFRQVVSSVAQTDYGIAFQSVPVKIVMYSSSRASAYARKSRWQAFQTQCERRQVVLEAVGSESQAMPPLSMDRQNSACRKHEP